MRPHVVRLRRRRVVGVAADIEIEIVLRQRRVTDHRREPRLHRERLEGVGDFLDVLGQQMVLGPALEKLAVGVDEQHPPLTLGRLAAGITLALTQHQHASRNAGAIKQIRRQPDDGFEQIGLDHRRPDRPLLATPEQHPVWHHGRQHPAFAQHRHHVLQKHQVRLLAAQRHLAITETLGVSGRPDRLALAVGIGRAPVDGKRRIGQHPVKPHQLAAFHVRRLGQRVVVAQIGGGDAVQQHVHLGNRPDRAIGLLPAQIRPPAIAPVLVDVILGENQHATRAAGWVINAVVLLRLDQANHHPHDGTRGIELAAFLARRIGKLADQVFIRCAEQVREFKILVPQPHLVEVADELAQLQVGNLALADLAREIDVLQYPGEAGIVAFQTTEGAVEKTTHILVRLLHQMRPARGVRHIKRLPVPAPQLGTHDRINLGLAGCQLSGDDLGMALVEHVRAAFEKQHPEDVFLELRGVHLAAQDVRGLEKVSF